MVMNIQTVQKKTVFCAAEQLPTALAGLQFADAVSQAVAAARIAEQLTTGSNRFVVRLAIYTTAPTAHVTCDASLTGAQ
jgi:hypothetical protein